MPQQRNRYIDMLKGYAIFMVVLGHSLQRASVLGLISVPAWVGNYLPFSGWVTMPLFFGISGYLCYGRVRVPRMQWVLDKGAMLLLPWAAWTLLYYVAARDPLWPTDMSLGRYMLGQAQAPSLWYFVTLFWIYALVAAGLSLGRWALPALALGTTVLWSPEAATVQYVWWFLAGWAAAPLSAYLVRYKWALWALSVPLYAVLVLRPLPAPSLLWQPAMAIGSAGVATLAVWLLQRTPLTRPLSVMGKRSLEIYAGQFLFVSLAFVSSYLNVVLTTTLAIAGSLLIGSLLRRWQFTNVLFLGARVVPSELPQPLVPQEA